LLFSSHKRALSGKLGKISLYFNGHFSGGPRLAGTRMSPLWILLELRMMVTTGAVRRVRYILSTNQHPFFIGQMPILSANQPCQSTEGIAILNFMEISKKNEKLMKMEKICKTGKVNWCMCTMTISYISVKLTLIFSINWGYIFQIWCRLDKN